MLRGHFLSSFPWGCRFCDRKFKLRPYLIDHCLNSKTHGAKLQQALKSSFTAKVCFCQAPQLESHHPGIREPGSMHMHAIVCTTAEDKLLTPFKMNPKA